MKLASFKLKSTGAATIGVVVDGRLIDLHAASGGELPASMIAFLELGEAGVRDGAESLQRGLSAAQRRR